MALRNGKNAMSERKTRQPESGWAISRIREKCQSRGISNADLARLLRGVGAEIHESALTRLFKSPPERTLSADELVAFSRVLGMSLDEMVRPHDFAPSEELRRQLEELGERQKALMQASGNFWSAVQPLLQMLDNAGLYDEAINTTRHTLNDAMVSLINLGFDVESAVRREVGLTKAPAKGGSKETDTT